MRSVIPREWNCFIDLHLHLDGSLSPACARHLAEMQGIQLPETEEKLLQQLTVSPDCRDLNEYLEKFSFPCSLLQTAPALRYAAAALERELQSQGLIYAELRFAPQKHCEKGLTQRQAVQAVLDGMGKTQLRSGLILCCMRGADNHAQNLETIAVAAEFREKGVCAVDLAGAEALFKTENFADVFALAREKGLHITIHAGEADGPDSIRTALRFGAERIGHGVRAVEDPALLRRLAEEHIFLELCPTSNLNTAVFSSMEEYPLPALLQAGVPVTINTDNMSVSGTTIRQELERLLAVFPLDKAQLKALLLHSAQGAFADSETKALLEKQIQESLH